GTRRSCAPSPRRTASRRSPRATTWWTPSSSACRSGSTRSSTTARANGWGRWADHADPPPDRHPSVRRSRGPPLRPHRHGRGPPGVLGRVRGLGAIDAVVHTGDASEDGTVESYRRLHEILDPFAAALDAPLAVVMGNHDVSAAYAEGIAPGQRVAERQD